MQPEDQISADEIQLANQFVHFLVRTGVKLLCFDFDLTLCSRWTDGEKKYLTLLRPILVHIFKTAIEHNIKTSITTFHTLARQIKKQAAPILGLEPHQLIVKTPLNVKTTSHTYWMDGKSPMIEASWKEAFKTKKFGRQVDFSKCFLIDDDPVNIEKASEDGCPAIFFNPKERKVTNFLFSVKTEESDTLEKFIDMSKVKPKSAYDVNRPVVHENEKVSESCSVL